MSQVHLHKLTRKEFRQRVESAELKACIIPVGAIEQHLEHLEMEHDWRSASEIATVAAQRLDPSVIVASGIMVGISEHHMNHQGSLSLRPSTFLAVLGDLINSVVRSGIKNVLVLNGHGGNVQPCQAVWDQFLREFKVNLQFVPYWELLDSADAEILDSGLIPGHAQEFETAIAAARFPENIRQQAMLEQKDKTPALATATNGQLLFERIVEQVTEKMRMMISGKSIAEIPSYFP